MSTEEHKGDVGNAERAGFAKRGEGSVGPAQDEKMSEMNVALVDRMSRIRKKIIVMSGKGGVGKSTVAVNLASSLSRSGRKVGLLDVDIHGPSLPTMLGIEGQRISGGEGGMLPIEKDRIKAMSIGLFLQSQDDAVIWRGPRKNGAIRQLLAEVAWGDLDYLIIDSPPGTGDEPLSVCQLIGSLDGAVIVTTPQRVAAVDVRKSITFCRQLDVPILGVIENMSGFVCPKCGELARIFSSGGGKETAENMGVDFLGSVPIDSGVAESGDCGRPLVMLYPDSRPAMAFREIASAVEDKVNK